MAERMIIECAGKGEVVVELNETDTAARIFEGLPVEASAQTWGEEVYFSTPFSIPQEQGTLDVSVGDVGWWPPGSAIAIFFGRTPASSGPKPVPASEVTIIGRVVEGLEVLPSVQPGDSLKLRRA